VDLIRKAAPTCAAAKCFQKLIGKTDMTDDTPGKNDTPDKNDAKATGAGATKAQAQPDPAQPQAGAAPRVVWDDGDMTSAFANVVNVLATREEMTLLFGTNQTWNATGTDELTVRLSNRIVLSPVAAKRLSLLLDRRVKEYEQLFGKLDV